MMALLSLILSIIMGLMNKQKQESAKRITGKANPTQREISKAYKILINDIKLLYKHKYNVNEISRAMYINLNPKKFAKNGIDWYQEQQFCLDRVLGNMNKEEISVPIGQSLGTIDIRKQIDYIPLYLRFFTSNFMYQKQSKYWIKQYRINKISYIAIMQGKIEITKAKMTDNNNVISIINRFFCALPNCFSTMKVIGNEILNNRKIDVKKWVQACCSNQIALYYRYSSNRYYNIWRHNKDTRYEGARKKLYGGTNEVIKYVDRFYKYYETNNEINNNIWLKIKK